MKGRFTRPRCYREWHRSAVGYTVIVLMEVSMANTDDWLNDVQFTALKQLYHNFNEAFQYLPDYIKAAYYARLYSNGG